MARTLQDQLNEVLDQFESSMPSIQATALVDLNGLVIASRLQGEVDDQRIGAMFAALLTISNRSGAELERGTIQRVDAMGSNHDDQPFQYSDPGQKGPLQYYVSAFNDTGESPSSPVQVNFNDPDCLAGPQLLERFSHSLPDLPVIRI